MNAGNEYLLSVKKELLHYKAIAEKSIAQLEPLQLFYAVNDDCNSIAAIIKHLHGNMLSRWTDFLTTDGEKPGRNRDAEFENILSSKEELWTLWEAGWDCFFSAIDSLTADDLYTTIYIRKEAHTVLQAINRQLVHYAYHIGQIVFAAKQQKDKGWDSLTIPKNKSSEFNNEKMGNKHKPIDGLDW